MPDDSADPDRSGGRHQGAVGDQSGRDDQRLRDSLDLWPAYGSVIDRFALLSEFTAFNNHYGYHLPAPSGLEADPQGPISRAVATRLLQVHPVQR